jgi:hypothetical protein
VGENLDVVCWRKPARDKADIQLAVIEEVSTYKVVPVYRLRSLDGTGYSREILVGESGTRGF